MAVEIKGIDVSHNNGTVDWEKVKASGIKFAMLRTGYGIESPNQIDKQFERNYSECKRVGMPVGAYHYSYAKSVDGARQEAAFMLKIIDGKQFEYPIVYDLEDTTQQNLGKTLLTNMVKAFCSSIENAGYYAMLYSNPNWLVNYLNVTELSAYDLWLAQWSTTKTYKGSHGMWQYSAKGAVTGISGDVDLDVAYKDYPTIIKKAGLNGYEKAAKTSTYTVKAEKSGLTSSAADVLITQTKNLGMTASKTEV